MFYHVTYGRTYVTHNRTQEAILTADCQKREQYRYYSQGRISQILSTRQYGCTQYFYRVYEKSAEQLLKWTEMHSS
jgi:hypothetical protein